MTVRDFDTYLRDRMRIEANGCWMWTGSYTERGVGRAGVKGHSTKAHRAAYEFWVEKLPNKDVVLRHHCGNKGCINPDHMFTDHRSMRDLDPKDYIKERVSISESGCWEWTKFRNDAGYGRCVYANESWSAHRLSYFAHIEHPGDGFVCHHCDNPPCCNPEHLYLGDNDTNMFDKALRERHPFMRFTRDDVAEMRRRRENGELLRVIAEDYGTSESVVCGIARRRTRTA